MKVPRSLNIGRYFVPVAGDSPPWVPGLADTPGEPAPTPPWAASVAGDWIDPVVVLDVGGGPPWVPGLAVTPGAPAPTAPAAASPPVADGLCFCTAVLGSTGEPVAGPVVVPGCPDAVPCWAIALGPRAISAVTAAPSKHW